MSQRTKTVIIWLVLIGMFLGIYRMLSPDSSSTVTTAVVSSVVAIAILVGIAAASQRGKRKSETTLERAVDFAHAGAFATAESMLADAAANGHYTFYVRTRLAWLASLKGQHAEAATMLRALHAECERAPSESMVELARFAALAGETDAAIKDLGDTDALNPHATITRAIIACRTQRYGDAENLLDEHWVRLETRIPAREFRVACVIRAFATASADPRDAGRAARFLVGIDRAQIAYVHAMWPELAAFLAT